MKRTYFGSTAAVMTLVLVAGCTHPTGSGASRGGTTAADPRTARELAVAREVGFAFRQYVAEHGGMFPRAADWSRSVQPYLSPALRSEVDHFSYLPSVAGRREKDFDALTDAAMLERSEPLSDGRIIIVWADGRVTAEPAARRSAAAVKP